MQSREHSLQDKSPLNDKALASGAVWFVFDGLFSSEDTWTMILGSDGIPGSAFGIYGCICDGNVPTPYPDDDDEDGWDSTDHSK